MPLKCALASARNLFHIRVMSGDQGDEGGGASLVSLGSRRLMVVDQAPSVPRERADAARNRERILKAARRLLRRRAMESICMDKIAEEAGVGKGTLYRRFPDRAALVHALLDEDTRRLQDRALAGFDLSPTATSVEHVLALIGELFEFTLDHAPLLSAAHAKDQGARYDHPAYAWQRTLLSGHLR